MTLWRQIVCLKVKTYEKLPQVNEMHDCRKIVRTASVSCMTMCTVGDKFHIYYRLNKASCESFCLEERSFIHKAESAASSKCTNLTDLPMLKAEQL